MKQALISCGLLMAVFCTSIQTGFAQEFDAEMMERWQAFMTPGKEHDLLAKKAGKWHLVIKMWMAPDVPMEESEGKSEMKMIMDGRYLLDHTESTFQGQSFKGMGLTGFDNMQKKYLTLWVDSMGTSFMSGEGTFNKESNQWEYQASTPDPMTGEIVEFRSTEKIINDDKWVMTMYRPGPDGKEFKNMEIVYTRQD